MLKQVERGVWLIARTPSDRPYPYGSTNVVSREQIDELRWSTVHAVVFRAEPDGPLWETTYQEPATERQECDRWFDADPVEAVQVEPYTVEVIKYRPVTEPAVPDTVAGVMLAPINPAA